jgi:hypothetical protein
VFDVETDDALKEIYLQMMWLGKRPGITPGDARAWYSHVLSRKFITRVRRFSGKVSKGAAITPNARLCLEHFRRMQSELTNLLHRHLHENLDSPNEFITLLESVEQVHLVLESENHQILKSSGCYTQAGVHLLDWTNLTSEVQRILWKRKLNGRVANAKDYRPA